MNINRQFSPRKLLYIPLLLWPGNPSPPLTESCLCCVGECRPSWKERKERRGGRLGRKNAVEADPPGGPEVSLILWESQQGNTETTDDTVSFLLPLNGSVIEVLNYWAGYRTGETKTNLCKRQGPVRWYFYVWAGWYVVICTSPPCQLEERIF